MPKSSMSRDDLLQELADLRRQVAELETQVQEKSEAASEATILLTHEIAERFQIEMSLEKEHNLLRTLINNIPDSVFVKDTEHRLVMSNTAHLQILGVDSAEEAVNKTDSDFFPDEYADVYHADERRIFETGAPLINKEEPYLDAMGQPRWAVTTKLPLYNELGRISGLVGISRDITDRKFLERKLRESLEQRNRQVRLSTRLAQDIAATADLHTLYQRAITQIQQQFGYYHTQLLRYDSERKVLSLIAGYGEAGLKMTAAGHQMPLGRGLTGMAALTGTSVLRPDVQADPNWQPQALLPKTKGELAVPIKQGRESAQVQRNVLEHFVAHNFDAVAVTAINPAVVAPVARQAIKQGIYVAATIDMGEKCQTALVTTQDFELGRLLGTAAGRWAARHVPAGRRLDVGILHNRPIAQFAERERGMLEGIASAFNGAFEVAAAELATDADQGLSIAERWLKTQLNLQMILAINDVGALGAYQAVIAAGKNNPDTFFVGGIDGVAPALDALAEKGAYRATVFRPAKKMGALLVRSLAAAIANQPFDTLTRVESALVTPENLPQFLESGAAHQMPPFPQPFDNLHGRKIGLSVMNLANPFFADLAEGARREAQHHGVELVVNDPKQVLGVLDVQSDVAGLLTEADQLALQGFCGQIAAAIEGTRLRQEMSERLAERAQLLEHLQQQNDYLFALHSTTLDLMNRLDLADLLHAVVTRAGQLLNTEHGFVALVDSEQTAIKVKVGVGLYKDFLGVRLKPGEGVAGRVWVTGEALIVDKYDTWAGRAAAVPPGIVRALVGVPLKSGHHVVGVLGAAHNFDSSLTFGDAEILLLNRFAQLVSVALENARLYAVEHTRTQEQAKQAELWRGMQEFSSALNASLDLDTVLDNACRRLVQLI
ncbi:MAG: GAF domain-containing protein, partial [Chloroflexi bacterium]